MRSQPTASTCYRIRLPADRFAAGSTALTRRSTTRPATGGVTSEPGMVGRWSPSGGPARIAGRSADDAVGFQLGDLVVAHPEFGQQLVVVLAEQRRRVQMEPIRTGRKP